MLPAHLALFNGFTDITKCATSEGSTGPLHQVDKEIWGLPDKIAV